MKCVIGIGSPFGDDQLGWKVVAQLEQTATLDASVRLSCCGADDLLFHLKQIDFAILVDAIHADLPIGQVCSWSQLSLLPETGLSSHGMSLGTVLQLAETLNQAPKRWIVCGVVVDRQCLEFDNDLSPIVMKAIPQLIQYITNELNLK